MSSKVRVIYWICPHAFYDYRRREYFCELRSPDFGSCNRCSVFARLFPNLKLLLGRLEKAKNVLLA
ncbi:MAG: hypothetical protein ACPLZF_06130 [Nitrososphaeria archaeon]